MKIKCYANNYMNIPEYMEIKLKNNHKGAVAGIIIATAP